MGSWQHPVDRRFVTLCCVGKRKGVVWNVCWNSEPANPRELTGNFMSNVWLSLLPLACSNRTPPCPSQLPTL